MAANVFLNSIQLAPGVDWTPLAPSSAVLAGHLVIKPYGLIGSDPKIDMRFRGGDAVALTADEGGFCLTFDGVDLAEIEVRHNNQNARVGVFAQSR